MNRLPAVTLQPSSAAAANNSTASAATVISAKQIKSTSQHGGEGGATGQPAVVKKKPYSKTNFTVSHFLNSYEGVIDLMTFIGCTRSEMVFA